MRAAAERRAAELEARRRADRLEGLSLHRRLFTAQCEALYRRPPADPAELRAFAEAVLVRYDDVVDEIMAKVE
jgi:hypothetical protein